MDLVVVESPTKAKTLTAILPKEYKIEASMGHIRDLPKSGLGVDVENKFEPEYVIPQKSKKVITALKKDAEKAKQVILATDPDREGEAIAWHLKELLSKKAKKFGRAVFHELTKDSIEEAFENIGEINMSLVDAQQARRILDRLVGYKLSPLLWKKVRYGLSAGRVQSVAMRLIVEREREREVFKPEEYWSIDVLFKDKDGKREFEASFFGKNGKKIDLKNEKKVKEVTGDFEKDDFSIKEITKRERKKKPYAPFKTSTLQQTMANIFSFSAQRTMRAAQKLFEKGYITYHRTDSLSLSKKFVTQVRKFAKEEIGEKYLPPKPVYYKTKSKSAQEAHEAVRPTQLSKIPNKNLKLGKDEFKLYSIVWQRALECQLKSAVYDETRMAINSDKGYEFKASGSIVKFDGWMAVSKKYKLLKSNGNGNKEIPKYKAKEKVLLQNIKPDQHFTQPPARYSDATLIKELEELGIGRPSTYAPTISTIQSRGYIEKEGRYFKPKDVAYVVNDLLVEHFPEIVDYNFTAIMEEGLDEIAAGNQDWVVLLDEFYKPFEQKLEKKDKELSKHEITNLGKSDEKCPECGRSLVYKLGKYGKFLSCSGYPECKYAKPIAEGPNSEKENYGECPNCEDGVFVLKQGRYGKFLACSNYPKCKTTKPYLEKIGVKCPKCGEGDVVVKKAKGRTFYGCSRYPDCDFSSWKKPKAAKD